MAMFGVKYVERWISDFCRIRFLFFRISCRPGTGNFFSRRALFYLKTIWRAPQNSRYEVNFLIIKLCIKKKLVTRLPNFPDHRIRYESFFLKNIITNKKIIFWKFTNFFKVGVGEEVVFSIILKYFKQLLPSQSRAIL